ncbi:MAG: hypothetical protein G01um101491_140 [Parcubacteria group bacterium Gr01-1014_91]|nr:MAG: hypothetical protein G01um101491_140 [Parcubacteria group bacterium Gr01-1014_91]
MSLKNLHRKAFWLFFASAFLFLVSLIGIIALFGVTIRASVVEVSALLSLLFAWIMTRHAESPSEEIRQWKAQELADEAWRLFLLSNPVGWLVWLW